MTVAGDQVARSSRGPTDGVVTRRKAERPDKDSPLRVSDRRHSRRVRPDVVARDDVVRSISGASGDKHTVPVAGDHVAVRGSSSAHDIIRCVGEIYTRSGYTVRGTIGSQAEEVACHGVSPAAFELDAVVKLAMDG